MTEEHRHEPGTEPPTAEAATQTKGAAPPKPLFGMLAEYSGGDQLVRAAREIRDVGYRRFDTFTPYPVHGIDAAMGIRPTRLPWFVFIAACVGCATAVALQWWTNAFDYPWIVSGKPFWSVPATIPITFELTVLFGAITAMVGMLLLNGLPHPSHPLDLKQRFARVTDDRFFLLIEASDAKFDEETTLRHLKETQPAHLEPVEKDTSTPEHLPRGIVLGLIVLATAAVLPFAYIAKARETPSKDPPIHIVRDMDFQPKHKAQTRSSFFPDQRATRVPVEGTVALGDLRADDHFHLGRTGDSWAKRFPSQVEPSAETMQRGQNRFNIYCAPCHGLTGDGEGMVAQRAAALAQGQWVPPSNLHQDAIRNQPVGELFNTITHGIRTMPPYGPLLAPEDRWAIVMYLRALQRSQHARIEDLPEAERRAFQ